MADPVGAVFDTTLLEHISSLFALACQRSELLRVCDQKPRNAEPKAHETVENGRYETGKSRKWAHFTLLCDFGHGDPVHPLEVEGKAQQIPFGAADQEG